MVRKTFIAALAALILAGSVLAETAGETQMKEVAEQWKAFVGKDMTTPKGLPPQTDVNFDKLGGRVLLFMFPSKFLFGNWMGKYYETVNLGEHFDFIKNVGGTDIIFNGGFTILQGYTPGRCGAKLAPRCYDGERGVRNSLIEAAIECRYRKMGLWIMVHGLGEGRCNDPAILKDHDSLYAKDDKGELYKVAGLSGKGGVYDIMKDEFFQFFTGQVDNLVESLKPYGCFKGFLMDEFWFNYQHNFFQPYFPMFSDFCAKNFGERPPAEIREKIGLRDKWHDLNDKWWRRYVLWREEIIAKFEKKFCDYVKKKGVQVINQRVRRGYFDRPYAWLFSEGIRDFSIGDWHIDGSKQDIYLPNSLGICWIYGMDQSRNHAAMVTGKPACAFTYWAMLAGMPKYRELIMKCAGKQTVESYFDQRATNAEEIKVLFRDIRRWDGAAPLQSAAVLMTDRGNIFNAVNPCEIYDKNEKALLDTLSYHFPVRVIDTELPAYFNKYNLLVASGKTALKGLSPDAYAQLRVFAENGGTLIAILPDATVSKKGDLTDEIDKTEELFGVKYGKTIFPFDLKFKADSPVDPELTIRLLGQTCPAVETTGADVKIVATLASDTDRVTPGITVRKMGKGAIVGVYFNLNHLLLGENDDVEAASETRVFGQILNDLVKGYAATPNVTVSGDVRIEECLKKDGELAITFLSDRKLPASGIVKVSSAVLELGAKYTVTSRCRGVSDKLKTAAGDENWTVADLNAGFKVTVTPERRYELIEIEKTK